MTAVTETVLIAAILSVTLVVIGVSYLVYLARLGKPLSMRFSGYGIDLKIGQSHICVDERGVDEE